MGEITPGEPERALEGPKGPEVRVNRKVFSKPQKKLDFFNRNIGISDKINTTTVRYESSTILD